MVLGMGREGGEVRRRTAGGGLGRRWPALLIVYPLAFLLMLGALSAMGARADHALTQERTLTDIESDLRLLDAHSLQEWSNDNLLAVNGLSSIQTGLADVTSEVGRLMAGAGAAEIRPVNDAFRTYQQDLTRTLDLASHGLPTQAIASFKYTADRSLGVLLPIVHEATLTFGTRASTAQRARDIGSACVLFLGLLVLSLLSIRSSRQRERLLSSQSQALVLEKNEQRFLSLMEGSADLVTILDPQGTVKFQSASIQRMLGWQVEEVLGHNLREFLHPEDAKALTELLGEVERSSGVPQTVDWRLSKADGETLHTEAILVAKFDDPEIRGFLVSVRDQSDRLVLEEALRHQAFHDPLTQLANRSLFEDRLAHAFDRTVRSDRSVCLLLADLDDFKDINDSYGHAFGDRVLIEVAARLKGVLRLEDTAARLGGDEFAILIEEVEDDDGLVVAERIMDALEAPISIDGTEVFVHASLGIVTGSGASGARVQDERSETQLLVDADLAMYEAKRQGRGLFRFYAPSMQEGVQDRLTMRSDLKRGLANNEFFLHYQPIFDIETEAIVGVEALVRWRHPERGLIPPLAFIPAAEQTGLILELGRWVLREACAQAAQWQDSEGRPGPYVSVNVAGAQLRQPSFIDDVRSALTDAGLDPGRLVVEMTESSLIDETDESVMRLERLHDLGIQLAIDDFGTGYSSLSYLRRFNMDILKIDKSFVDELGHDDKRSALVAAMVGMGSSLGMKVVAEGIEERMQLEDLRELRCDLGQGYLIAKPLPPEELAALLGAERRRKAALAVH
jgi:diguanylate cyclase (GGDEF)-like protein/PAS domain S-box-containing protein